MMFRETDDRGREETGERERVRERRGRGEEALEAGVACCVARYASKWY